MLKIPKTSIQKSKCWFPTTQRKSLINSNSWFKITKLKNNVTTFVEEKINTSQIRCKQITLNPKLKERNILLTWFELYRRAYNTTIKYLRQKPEKTSFYDVRKNVKICFKNNLNFSNLIKKNKVYTHTLDNAIKDVIKARKIAFSNLKQKNINHFRLRYKKKNHHLKTLVLEANTFNIKGLGLKIKMLQDLNPSEIIKTNKECRLGYNKRTCKFTLYVPYEKTIKTTLKRSSTCSLDPGVRTFQSVYSPDGYCYEFNDTNNVISKSLERIEKVKLLKQEPWYKKYTERLREKLKNRVADLHWKTCNFLCKNFNNILIGNMSTISIVKNQKSVLNDATKRKLYTLSHHLFKLRLQSKATEYNVKYKEVDESYTSKTCGGCGNLNNSLGSSKIFKCGDCNFSIDRDVNGARNIYIKHT